jgi:hypothetical protein
MKEIADLFSGKKIRMNQADKQTERTKGIILAHGRAVSPYFDERQAMHGGVISVEEEFGHWMRAVDTGNADVEIRENRTGADDVKPLSRLQIEQLAQSNPRPLTQDEAKQLLKVQRVQPSPTIQLTLLGEPEPVIERLEVEIKRKPGPKTSRQERNAEHNEKLLKLQLNSKQLHARNRRLRQLKNREKRPGAYQPPALRCNDATPRSGG